MSYWTKRRKINESLAQQMAELSSRAYTNDHTGITSRSSAEIPPLTAGEGTAIRQIQFIIGFLLHVCNTYNIDKCILNSVSTFADSSLCSLPYGSSCIFICICLCLLLILRLYHKIQLLTD